MGKLAELRDRLSGRLDDDLTSAVLQWASASKALFNLVSTGSLISASDRDLVAELVRERLDGLLPIEGFDPDQLMLLESQLRHDAERAARAAEVSGG